MNYKSYSDLSLDILQEIYKVSPEVQLILGVPRSGMIPAYMIAAQLNLPVVSLDEFLNGEKGSRGNRPIGVEITEIKNILVVDDSYATGSALQKVKERLKIFNQEFNIKYTVVYSAIKNLDEVDFYFKYLPLPRVFQWNYKNHLISKDSCYDIDGVLCVDPTDKQNDDGVLYIEFLLNAKPLFIPQYPISCLVTSRLEKYRSQTEHWLKKHQVIYDELIMLDLPDAITRRKLGIHSKFKAKVFVERNESYFIESNWSQAKDIFKLSKKPVFCIENDVLINSYTDIIKHENDAKYSNRFFNDVFSDRSELGNKIQELKMSFDELEVRNQVLIDKIKRIENNVWYKFSKYPSRKKMLFLINKLFRQK